MDPDKLVRMVEGNMSLSGFQLTDEDRDRIRYLAMHPEEQDSVLQALLVKHKVNHHLYPAVFSLDPNGEISVWFPDLDVATSGIDEDDALTSARALLSAVLHGMKEDGASIPEPTPIYKITLESNEYAALIDVFKGEA